MADKPAMILILLLLTGGIVSAWEITDVNGTWADNPEALSASDLPERNYSWGKGKTIPNSSISLDLGRGEVLLSGMGLFFIDSVLKDDEGSIRLKLFYVGDDDHEHPLTMKISFMDYGKAYIVCYPQKGWWSKPLSSEEKWMWYRLSAPAGS